MALALLPIIVCVPEWEHGACESRCICVCVRFWPVSNNIT